MNLFDRDKFDEILQTLARNRSRSFLTAFGVFWGIFMLVVLIGGGNGLTFMMNKQTGGFANNSCMIMSSNTSEAYLGFRKGRYWNMNINDIEILKANVKGIDLISPVIFGNQAQSVRDERSGNYSIKGTMPNYLQIQKSNLLYGRYINDIDILEQRKVCVIGERVYQGLFANGENPLGAYIRVNGIYYQVIGVAKPVNENMSIGGNENEMINLPLTTMQKTFRMGNEIHLITFTSKQNSHIAELIPLVEKYLKKEHKIAPHDKKAIFIMNIEEQFMMFNNLILGIRILVWIVGIGTLLAGIIGVSNIMMITVKERTQEIGVRRALGAKPFQIISQILIETAILTGVAGIFGIALGVFILQLADVGISGGGGESSGFQIGFWTAILTTCILLFLSILSGLAPAYRALRIKAIDALRDE